MHIPDPVELMEMRAERNEERYIRGENFICCDCKRTFPLSEANTTSPDPSSPPICWGRLEKLYPQLKDGA